jgi:hypothetical protein
MYESADVIRAQLQGLALVGLESVGDVGRLGFGTVW